TFVAMIPLLPDSFMIDIRAIADKDTVFSKKNVYVPSYYLENARNSLAIDTSFFRTFEETEIRQGEKMTFFTKGTPGASASFSILGFVQNVRMRELHPRKNRRWDGSVFKNGKPPFLPKIRGIYAGTYVLPENAQLGKASLRFTFSNSNRDTATAALDAAILVKEKDFQQTAVVEYQTVVTDESSDHLEPVFFAPGTRISVTGRIGNDYRVALSSSDEVWIPRERIRFPGISFPQKIGRLSNAKFESFPNKVRFTLQQTHRLPFRIIQNTQPQRLSLLFYGAGFDSTLNEIDRNDKMISKILWQQKEENIVLGTFYLNSKQQWGYRAFYQDSTFILEIKRPPKIAKTRQALFQNLLICLDPGHSPANGSIGPTGLKEKQAASNYARLLKELLERKGAKVILTRGPADGINLSSRTMFANQINADLFISLHFNALPDGVNPMRSRGTSTYFFHQQSQALAEAVQKQILQNAGLRKFGLYQNDLAVCRITSMPAVLLEPAFIMIPYEEMKIVDPEFQKRVCEGIVRGIENFLFDSRE
ncbi:MAG: N-acetylmuramoyl-L-alanine amidase, partial [bacterium]